MTLSLDTFQSRFLREYQIENYGSSYMKITLSEEELLTAIEVDKRHGGGLILSTIKVLGDFEINNNLPPGQYVVHVAEFDAVIRNLNDLLA